MFFIIIWAAGMILCGYIMAKRYARCKKPFVAALISSSAGLAAHMGINAIATLTGVFVAVNYVTVSCSVILGIPGVIAMLLLGIMS